MAVLINKSYAAYLVSCVEYQCSLKKNWSAQLQSDIVKMNYFAPLLLMIPFLALGESYIPRAETDPTPRWPYYASIFIDDLAGSAKIIAQLDYKDTENYSKAVC